MSSSNPSLFLYTWIMATMGTSSSYAHLKFKAPIPSLITLRFWLQWAPGKFFKLYTLEAFSLRHNETSISPRVLQKRHILYRQAKEARVWVEVEYRAHGPRLQGPRGVFTPSHHKLSQLISRLYRVCFYYLAYGQKYCLILVHSILLLHHLVWMFWAWR